MKKLLVAAVFVIVLGGIGYFVFSIQTPNQGVQDSITSPREGDVVSAVEKTTVRWQASSDLVNKYKNFVFILTLEDSRGNQLGGIQDGRQLSAFGGGSAVWDVPTAIIKNYYANYLTGTYSAVGLNANEKYRIVGRFSINPTKAIDCVPHGSKDCQPVYSAQDEALRKEANTYRSTSGWFTFTNLPN